MVENAPAAGADGTGIVERLARKRVLITGVTGFLGQVLLERLLLDFPETAVAVLVRRQQSQSAHARVEYLLRKPAFDPLRERLGEIGLLRVLDDRVEVIEGDFSKGPPDLPPKLDVVFHCAATVSFDPPIDEGFG